MMRQSLLLILFLGSCPVYAQSEPVSLYLQKSNITWGSNCLGGLVSEEKEDEFILNMLDKLVTQTMTTTDSNYRVVINHHEIKSPASIVVDIMANCKKINERFNVQLTGQLNFISRCPAQKKLTIVSFSGFSSGYKDSFKQALGGMFSSESEFHMERPLNYKNRLKQSVAYLIHSIRDVAMGIKDCGNHF